MKIVKLRKHVAVVLVLGSSFLVACQPGEVKHETTATESDGAALPGAGVLAGWELVSQPENYGSENLWDYINGQAEFYLNYGFLRVDTAEYRAEGGSPSVVVEVYQMASPEEAFGIYAAERNPDDRSIEIGSGGYLGSNVLNFWQGKNYIKLISFEAGAATEDALVALAREISARNPAGSGVPEIFSYFPDEGRIEASERYFPKGFLGQGYLDRAYRIDYATSDAGSYQLFLLQLGSNGEAIAALERYAAFLRSMDYEVESISGESTIVASRSGATQVVFVLEEFLGGVLEAATPEEGRMAADGFATRLADFH